MRNGRKSTTSVEGIPKTCNLEKMLKEFKKKFACNGHIPTEVTGTIQLFGDKRDEVKNYLIQNKIANDGQIMIHGF